MNKIKEFFSSKKNKFIVALIAVLIVAAAAGVAVGALTSADGDYNAVKGGAQSKDAQALEQSLKSIETWQGLNISFVKTYTDGRTETINIKTVSGDRFSFEMDHVLEICQPLPQGETISEVYERAMYKDGVLYTGTYDENWPHQTKRIVNDGEFEDMVETYIGDYASRFAVITAEIIISLYKRSAGGSVFYKVIYRGSQADDILDGSDWLEIIAEKSGSLTKQVIIRYDLNKNGYYDSNNCTVSIVFSHSTRIPSEKRPLRTATSPPTNNVQITNFLK